MSLQLLVDLRAHIRADDALLFRGLKLPVPTVPATAVAVRMLALILAVALCPGVAEATDDLAHYVAEGHTLHAPAVAEAAHEGHDDHEKEHGDEHGCSALFHVCGCHSPTPSLITLRLNLERGADLQSVITGVLAATSRRPQDGVHHEAFRPPIA